jgi:hypothetical protein
MHWRFTIVRPSCKGLYGIRWLIPAVLMPGRWNAITYVLGKGDKRVLFRDKFRGDIYET